MITAVLLRVVFARTVFHLRKSLLEDPDQCILLCHQLLQISSSTGHRIIDNKILFPIIRIRNGDFADGCAQVVHIAEVFLHSQHKCSNERFQLYVGRVHCRRWNQKAQNLRLKFPVQEKALFIGIFSRQCGILSGLTIVRMIRSTGLRLNLSAVSADLKAFSNILFSGNRHLLTGGICFSEVNLAKRCLPDEFVSKWKVIVVHLVCTGDVMVFIHIDQKLPHIECIGPLLTLVADKTLGIIHIGIDHLDFQHAAYLAGICPRRASADRTACCMLASFFNLSMGTIRAQSPACSLRCRQVDLINLQSPSAGIEAVVRSKFTDC